ncbi:MAG: hypothetical protein EOM53_04045 [Alphaproteobacteria bacterium]|nr:hypothetical protein [Alphaproteobacteria bacterium]
MEDKSQKIWNKTLDELGFQSELKKNAFYRVIRFLIFRDAKENKSNPFLKEVSSVGEARILLEDFLQEAFHRRWNLERTDMRLNEIFSENIVNEMREVFQDLGMVDPIEPSYKKYDVVLILGAVQGCMEDRLESFLDKSKLKKTRKFQLKSGVSTQALVGLGSQRMLWPLIEKQGEFRAKEPLLLDILAERLGNSLKQEISAKDVFNKCVEIAKTIPKEERTVVSITDKVSKDSFFKTVKWPTEAEALSFCLKTHPLLRTEKVYVVDTPNIRLKDGTYRRANTIDTYREFMKEYPEVFNKKSKILLVSEQPYSLSQLEGAKFCFPENIEVDVLAEGSENKGTLASKNKELELLTDSFIGLIHIKNQNQFEEKKRNLALFQKHFERG